MDSKPTPTKEGSPTPECPNCGSPLTSPGLAGLCPRCLLGPGAETEGGGNRGRFRPPTVESLAALFPRLEIRDLLGIGGMGAVYRARQPELDRVVALKILPAESGPEAGSAERFNREARALARLSHPCIVAVFEFGQVPGYHYFLMELVDGANLRQLVRQGRISGKEALRIIPAICDALQYAHDQGVVHRDIKPENVLLDRQGRVKIADFGLARILGGAPGGERLTMEGQVIGTPHYMAPEQVERPLSVDHRADLYSVGVVFYELLTGELPIGKFPPPSTKRVVVDVRLDEVVLRALENDPERRYQQASEIKSRVETIRDSCGSAAAPGPEAGTTGAQADEDPGKPDWREWVPFQSAQVREIYRHYTPEERREDLRLAARIGLPGVALSVGALGIFAALIDRGMPGIALLVALAYTAAIALTVERANGRARSFMASTAWARRRGWRPETLRMFSLHPYESARPTKPGSRFWWLLASAAVLGLLFFSPGWPFGSTATGGKRIVPADSVPSNPPSIADPVALDPSRGGETDPRALEVAPQLRYLAWQRRAREFVLTDLHDAEGRPVSFAGTPSGWSFPPRVDVDAMEGGRKARFLHVWMAHPGFDRWNQASVSLYRTDGSPLALGGGGSAAMGQAAFGLGDAHERFLVTTLSPGEGDAVPEVLGIRLEYVVGPLERLQDVPADFRGSMSLAHGGQLNGVGQDSDGKAFVSLALELSGTQGRKHLVQAVAKDGTVLRPSSWETGGSSSGPVRVERYAFDSPLEKVRTFQVGTRPIREVRWDGVRLPPRQPESAAGTEMP